MSVLYICLYLCISLSLSVCVCLCVSVEEKRTRRMYGDSGMFDGKQLQDLFNCYAAT